MNEAIEVAAAFPLARQFEVELEQARNSGNALAVTGSRVRLAFASGDPESVSRALLEHCGIRAEVRLADRALYVTVKDHYAFANILRILRRAFNVVGVTTTDGRMCLKVFLG